MDTNLVRIETQISWGYRALIEIFGRANSLVWKLERKSTETPIREYIIILYEEGSDTAVSLSFLTLKHLGVENMLCDYLMKCNIDPIMIPVGQYVMRKDEETMEEEWQQHRKKIGLTR